MGDWLKWIDKKLVFGGRQAQKYISIYEGRDELRALANTNSGSHLSINGCLRLLRKTDREANGEQPAAVATDSKPAAKQKLKSADDQISTAPSDDEKTIWRKGLLERAQKATSLAAYDDTWAAYSFDAEVIDATAQAAAAWNELATYLRERQLPF